MAIDGGVWTKVLPDGVWTKIWPWVPTETYLDEETE